MKKSLYLLFILSLITGIFVKNVKAQFTVTGSSGADYTYTSLTAATSGVFAKINATAQTGNNIVITVTGNSTAETGATSLNAGAWSSIKIYTTGTFTISTSSTSYPLINFNGADNVTIDGRVGQSGTIIALTLSHLNNTANTSRTIRFANDATNNIIQYCKITGACPSSGAGLIFFSSTTETTGNDGNTIDNCEITSSSARPLNVIYSSGTAGKENSGNIISNNKIFDFFNFGNNSYGIFIDLNSTDWNISGNSFYETNSFIPTAGVNYSVICIKTGNNFTVAGNYIGGNSAQCGGTWNKTNAFDNPFYAIYLNVGTVTSSNIQGNIIKGFNWSNSAAASFYGIYLNAGSVNIGTTTGNTIGAPTGTGSVALTNGTNGGAFYGIYYTGSGTGNIQNNSIGSVTTNNSNTAYNTNFYGIRIPATGTINIGNNTIGSTITVNSINVSSASTGTYQMVEGIYSSGSLSNIIISSNTIANMTNGTSYGEIISGIYIEGTGAYTISGNNIRDLSAVTLSAIYGIYISNTGTSGIALSGNSIYNLSASSASFTGGIYGLYYAAGTSGIQNISGNFIYGFSLNSDVTNSTFYGIRINSGNATFSNNIISLGGNTKTTIFGIYESGTALNNNNLYYNTLYIFGNLTSDVANQSYALYSAANNNTRDFRNNIFSNVRSTTGGTNLHYSVCFNYSTSANLTLDFNDYYVSGTGGVLGYYGVAKTSLPVVTGLDVYSYNGNPGLTNAGGSSSTDYKPNITNANSWVLSGNGMHIGCVAVDFSGASRPASVTEGAPDIGAYEFTASTGSAIPNAFNITPVTGSNDIFVNGRKLINLYFNTLSNTLPTSIEVKFYSGINPPGVSGSPAANAYFSVVPTGGSGYNYDITYYYSEPQRGTVINENNITLAKSENGGTTWDSFCYSGNGQNNYQLDPVLNTVKVFGLTSFSTFTSTDYASPLPAELISFAAMDAGRDVKLIWTTVNEINNAGFEVERKIENGIWKMVGFVIGSGNTNKPVSYSYLDTRLNSGKYNYRLKQMDVNGHFTYHNLTGEVVIALPTKYDLSQNYPNPFNPATKIDYSIPFAGKVSIIIYDMLGREMKKLINEYQRAGFYTAEFNGINFASGIYMYRLNVDGVGGKNFAMTKKMVFIQ